ncbi:oxidation resistance protein 1 isoform X4 [Thrips palmi]|uniref:Oxidation resistance protein 1 n=1 Tax=Thrips palmi TaxID=161013 RepID=A0A6P8ZHW3_THRPL|nr:oxidation resistance protein 1 isoform X4 [Thrips palmi]
MWRMSPPAKASPLSLFDSGRRASVAPEVTQPPTYLVPYQRSKSRSVDHGFSPPFDLDSLRHSVDNRMQSAEKLARADSDGASGSSRDPSDKKMGRHLQPLNTITYTVKASDTLTSVAARFDTTPSELAKMNRLATRLVFPGQVLFVPDKKGAKQAPGATLDTSLDGQDSEGAEDGDASSPKPSSGDAPEHQEGRISSGGPGRAERIGEHSIHAPTRSRDLERFLKITVRHITDGQGVVSGVLLVTPNAVMFDPNVSDQLVIEHGPESYGVIAPMEFVVNAAIYYDIAHMRVGNSDAPKGDATKPEIYHPKDSKSAKDAETHGVDDSSISPGKESLLVKDETFPELAPGRLSTEEDDGGENGDNESESSFPAGREGSAFPKAFERDLVTPTNLTVSQNTSRQTSVEENVSQDLLKDTSLEEKKDGERSVSMESSGDEAYTMIRKMEQRRMSSLDHHWAVPKQKGSQDSKDGDGEVDTKTKDDLCHVLAETAEGLDEQRGNGNLIKSSCHDSGIDIRDADQPPLPPIIPCTKKVFSDADIVMASKNDFVPPITVAPTNYLTELEQQSSDDAAISGSMLAAAPTSRKKTSSVSFSVDDEGKEGKENKEEDADKQESRKNKVLKRLSYPLAWMEGFTGDKDEKDSLPGLPSSADSQSQHSSVFSKVFSSSPINLVSDFGSGLFLMKTPSEESGGSGGTRGASPGPPQTPGLGPTDAPPAPPAPPSPEIREVLKEGIETGFSVVGNTATSIISSVSNVGRSSVGTFIGRQQTETKEPKERKPPAPKLDIRSMVDVDEMPDLFRSIDLHAHAPNFPLLDGLELIPQPARSCEDPPLYLRLRMGKPVNRKIPKSTPIMSYGKKKMRPEYWFGIPRNRVDDLYKFLHLWIPHLYGDLEEMDYKSRGYELVESDTELWDDEPGSESQGEGGRRGSDEGELGELTRESWEMVKAPYAKLYNIIKTQTMSADSEQCDELVSMSEELRRALYATNSASFDLEILVPDLVGVTEILTEDHRKELCRHLPARAEGYVWTLVFSTSQHGFSLNSMYRKMQRLESPILLVIQDTDNNVFGALTSCALKVSDHFYGTGESLLFRFQPQFQVYNWTGDNMYFIKGNNESLAIGAGDGRFGLWLDGDLYQGRSQSCSTYGNDPLSINEDFVVKTLECWAFI